MSLIKCPECGADISEKAFACPKCGHPRQGMEELRSMSRFFWWGFEWKSKTKIMNWPLVHVAVGRDKTTGKLLVAKGIIAVGQFAVGVITIAQFGIGILFGFGQFMLGTFIVSQFALGYIVVAQFGIGIYVLAQLGFGSYVWSMTIKNPQAIEFFQKLFINLTSCSQ